MRKLIGNRQGEIFEYIRKNVFVCLLALSVWLILPVQAQAAEDNQPSADAVLLTTGGTASQEEADNTKAVLIAGVPEVPSTPEEPSISEVQSTPEEPSVSDVPETPEKPGTPEEPGTSDVPEVSENPSISEEPATPEEPDTSEDPDTSAEPDTSEVSGTPEEPGTSEELVPSLGANSIQAAAPLMDSQPILGETTINVSGSVTVSSTDTGIRVTEADGTYQDYSGSSIHIVGSGSQSDEVIFNLTSVQDAVTDISISNVGKISTGLTGGTISSEKTAFYLTAERILFQPASPLDWQLRSLLIKAIALSQGTTADVKILLENMNIQATEDVTLQALIDTTNDLVSLTSEEISQLT